MPPVGLKSVCEESAIKTTSLSLVLLVKPSIILLHEPSFLMQVFHQRAQPPFEKESWFHAEDFHTHTQTSTQASNRNGKKHVVVLFPEGAHLSGRMVRLKEICTDCTFDDSFDVNILSVETEELGNFVASLYHMDLQERELRELHGGCLLSGCLNFPQLAQQLRWLVVPVGLESPA